MVARELIKRFRIFDSIPDEIAGAIQERAQIAPYAPGEVVVPVGQPFTFFGLVLEGEVSVYLPEQEGEPHSIETLGPGSHFAWTPLST
jgi:CRP-like cAMP-binding protein